MKIAHKAFAIRLTLGGLLLSTAAASALHANERRNDFIFSSFDPPESVLTWPQGINDAGDISGAFRDARGEHGFLLRRGEVTVIDYPGAAWTHARGINAQGEIVGTYGWPGEISVLVSPASLSYHGFLRSRTGQLTPLHHAGHLYEIPQRITSTGIVLGCYHDMDFMASMIGFTLSREVFNAFTQVPSSMHNGATPDASRIVGLYNDLASGERHGYLVDKGRFVRVDVPDSSMTQAWDINPQGEIVGDYRDLSGRFHGFFRDEEGEFTVIDVPGATNTGARGINARGEIVGWYDDPAGTKHGFLARPRSVQGDRDCGEQVR